MQELRPFPNRLRFAALWLTGLALAVRLLVPGGVMPVVDGGRLVLSLCSGTGPATVVVNIGEDRAPPADQADAPCAFAPLGSPALAGADPVLLAAAIAVAMVRAARAAAPSRIAPVRLRPPVRGPPTPA